MELSDTRKRNVAFRLRIGDILKGKLVSNKEKFLYLDYLSNKVNRVNLIANCVDKFIQETEKKYGSITVDDASGQIRVKVFGDDLSLLKDISQGDTLRIIGNIKYWNGEVYIIPEIIKKIEPSWLLVRKLEIQNSRMGIKTNNLELKEKILAKIKDSEPEGIEIDNLILDTPENPASINEEIRKLLEEGLIYEPRPGKLRYLG